MLTEGRRQLSDIVEAHSLAASFSANDDEEGL